MPYADPVVDDVLSGYIGRGYPPLTVKCRLPECKETAVRDGDFEGYCLVHWRNLQSWLKEKQ